MISITASERESLLSSGAIRILPDDPGKTLRELWRQQKRDWRAKNRERNRQLNLKHQHAFQARQKELCQP